MYYNMVEVGKRIKNKRNNKGMTQFELAEKIGGSASNVYKIEAGKNGASIDLLIDISEVLDSSLDYLLLGKTRNDYKDRFAELIDGKSEQQVELAYKLLCCLFENMK